MADPTPPVDDLPLHPGSLEGISRLRIDCSELDLAIEADSSLVDAVHLVVSGGNNAPSLIREGTELIVYQRGRYRTGGRPATLLVPEGGCPPIAGSLDKGDLHLDRVVAPIAIKHGMGDARVNGGDGDLALDAGKGDVQVAGRDGALALRSGMGDVRVARCRGSLAIGLGKGDVNLDTCEGELDLKLGSGDVAATDCSGGLAIKTGNGDVVVTRPRGLLLTVTNANGDVGIRGGSLAGLNVRTARGDITSGAHLIFIPPADAGVSEPLDVDDPNLVSRILRSRGINFEAGDKGLRIDSGPFHFEASDAGLRIQRGKFALRADDEGLRVDLGDAEEFGELGAFELKSSGGDISVDVPGGTPLRVEALVNGGDIKSDVPLVSVGRPGPRGSTQRYVGVTDPNATARLNLRVRTDRGDIRIRSVAGMPSPQTSPTSPTIRLPRTPPTPPTPPTPTTPPRPETGVGDAIAMPASAPTAREQRMRAILDALASGEITVSEADRRLAELEREG